MNSSDETKALFILKIYKETLMFEAFIEWILSWFTGPTGGNDGY